VARLLQSVGGLTGCNEGSKPENGCNYHDPVGADADQRSSAAREILVDRRAALFRYDPQHAAFWVVGEEPQRTIGAGAHVADTLAEIAEQPFLANDLLAIKHEAV